MPQSLKKCPTGISGFDNISDCVVFLDHRMIEQIATRRLRVIKYRGTAHGTNEYPFLLTTKGFSVFPITELEMNYAALRDRISTGIERLDNMLGGKGYFRGSSILVSGTAGTGKSSLGATFAVAACQRGEQAVYFSFEEAADQIIRNMESIGIDLKPFVASGLLKVQSVRATTYGLENHLAMILKHIDEINPVVVIIDPISNLNSVGDIRQAKELLTRIIDYIKMKGITALFTDLTHSGSSLETTEVFISSLMDTWILLRNLEFNGERNRGIYVLKSRGMDHSNQVREFLITSTGIQLKDVYLGPKGVLTGTARVIQEAEEKTDKLMRSRKIERLRRELRRKEDVMQSHIKELKSTFASEREEIEHAITEAKAGENVFSEYEDKLGFMRGQD